MAAEPSTCSPRSTLAMYLARIAMPASYVVTQGLAAIMPSLPAIRSLDPVGQHLRGQHLAGHPLPGFHRVGGHDLVAHASAVGSAGRGPPAGGVVCHRSPTLRLPPRAIPWAATSPRLGLWQGLPRRPGMVYAASLYFGMVLSEGSTADSGGYHESLIGLGSALGPGPVAASVAFFPGSLAAGMIPVAGIMTPGASAWPHGSPSDALPRPGPYPDRRPDNG